MCKKLQKESIYIEGRHEVLVDELKEELCSIMRNSQEECHLDIENR